VRTKETIRFGLAIKVSQKDVKSEFKRRFFETNSPFWKSNAAFSEKKCAFLIPLRLAEVE